MSPAASTSTPQSEEAFLTDWYLQSRHQFVAKTALELSGLARSGRQVLDAGCGAGGVSRALEQQGVQVFGCDLNEAALQWGKQQGRLRQAEPADLCRLPYETSRFDQVVCSEVLEHIPDDTAALKELLRVSKGPVFITIPAHRYLWTDSDDLLGHIRRYNRQEVKQLVEKAGGRLICMAPFGAITGVFLLAYRAIHRQAAASTTPLAARIKLPRLLDRILYLASTFELALARRRLMPWGHAWWAQIQKPPVT